MNVCFFGIYDPQYARTRVLRRGFIELGHEVYECRVDPALYSGARKYLALYRAYRRLKQVSLDHVVVCYPGHTIVWLARLLFGRRILFDAFVSLYDSNVNDRRSYASSSFYAWRDRFWDWMSCALAARVLLDTNAHIQYFYDMYGVPKEKCIRVWIGADDTLFHPVQSRNERVCTVHFHGSFIPLQGIPIILEAAALLQAEDIQFRMIGSGEGIADAQHIVLEKKLSNVTFIGRVPIEQVPHYMGPATIALGIFGTSEKTARVIPNKVYEALAMGKAIITADTPALRELMPEAHEVLAVSAGDARALANAIIRLRGDAALCRELGARARTVYCKLLTPRHIVSRLLADI